MLTWFIGSRYTSVKRKNYFISFISMTSMLGIAIGVMTLITVLSVMNGFSQEMRSALLSTTPHMTLKNTTGVLKNWQPLIKQIGQHPEVFRVLPFTLEFALLKNNQATYPVMVNGVDPVWIDYKHPLTDTLLKGNIQDLGDTRYGVIVSQQLADSLGIDVGETITLFVPDVTASPAGLLPRVKQLKVLGIFDSSGSLEYRQIFIHINDASMLFKRFKHGISGLEIKLKNEFNVKKVNYELSAILPQGYYFSDWMQEFNSFFAALKMQKTAMWAVLLLIVAVATFNLVSSLVMIVTDKRADIAILRTMGASKKDIVKIFMAQGVLIGGGGTLLGTVLGLLLANNVTSIAKHLEDLLSVQFVAKDVYLIGFLPSTVIWQDVVVVVVCSLIMSVLATLYPAKKAAEITPAEALRYE